MTPEQKKILEEIRIEKRIEADRERLKGTKFPVDIRPAGYMDRINYLTSGIQSMASPAIRMIEKAEEGLGAPLHALGRTGGEMTQKQWEESVNRGRTFHKMEHSKEGDWDPGQLAGEVVGAYALTKGQGVQPTAVGRVGQAMLNTSMLAPLFSDKDTGEAMREGMELGSVLGPAAETIGPIWRHTGQPAWNYVKGLRDPVKTRVAHALRRVLEPHADDVARAMESTKSRVPGEPLTSGQAAVPAGSREMSAVQKIAEAKDPTKYGKLAERQLAARQAHLAKQGGRVDMMKSDRAIATGPKREAALARADIGTQKTRQLSGEVAKQRQGQVSAMKDEGQLRTMAAQQKTLAEGGTVGPHFDRYTPLEKGKTLHGGTGKPSPSAYPVPGQPRVPARYTENIHRVAEAASGADDAASIAAAKRGMVELRQYQLDSLAAHGHFPLVSKDIVRVIDYKLKDAALSTVERNALRAIKKDILGRTETDGFIRSDALYTVRKEIGLKLEGIFSKMGVKWDKAQAGKAQGSIQKIIDDVIEGAGGAGWKDYLRDFAERSVDIEAATAANKVAAALVSPSGIKQRSADQFARITSKEPIKSGKLQAAKDAVQESLNRDAKLAEMAEAGRSKIASELGVEIPRVPTVGPMSLKLTLFRSYWNKFVNKMDNDMLAYLASIADEPEVVAEIIRLGKQSPASQEAANRIISMIPAAGAGVTQSDNSPVEKIPFVGDYF